MDRLSQIYLLQSSFLIDYATVSQHKWTLWLGICCQQPALLKVNQMWVRWRAHPPSAHIWSKEQISKAYTTFLTSHYTHHDKGRCEFIWCAGQRFLLNHRITDKTDRNKNRLNIKHIFLAYVKLLTVHTLLDFSWHRSARSITGLYYTNKGLPNPEPACRSHDWSWRPLWTTPELS